MSAISPPRRSLSSALAGAAAPLLALTAWISLNPYFLWGTSKPLIAASAILALAAAAYWLQGSRPANRLEACGFLVLALFLVYITALPKTDGGHIKWIYVLPTVALIALLDDAARRRCLRWFSTAFALSLVPGVLVALLAVLGVPLTFTGDMTMPVIGAPILRLPGALFIETNSVVLPWGGVLFRLCAIYDEPGTVGTIAALLLAAHAFRFDDWRCWVLFCAGVLSFSLAFIALAAAGVLVMWALQPRRLAFALSLAVLVPAALLASGIWTMQVQPGARSALSVKGADGAVRPFVATDIAGRELRQVQKIDNRVTPQMAGVLDRYFTGDLRTRLFGIASDASVVGGNISQTWKRILTDYGFIGLALCAIGLLALGFAKLRSANDWQATGLLLALYAASLYQRPVFWLPYALVILLCACPSRVGRERSLVQ